MDNNNSESEKCTNSRKNSFIQAVKDILNQNQDKNHITNNRPVTCKRPKRQGSPLMRGTTESQVKVLYILTSKSDQIC